MKRSQRKLPRDAIARARRLRQLATTAERLFWELVRNRQFAGFKFRRQHPIGPYTVDFYCAALRVVVELDGAAHRGRKAEDAYRQEWLERRGFRVIRFTNRQVEEETRSVRLRLLEVLRQESARRAT